MRSEKLEREEAIKTSRRGEVRVDETTMKMKGGKSEKMRELNKQLCESA